MRYIDPTCYLSRRSPIELDQMATAGIAGIVEPTSFYGAPRRYPETYLDDFERLLGPEANRAAQYGIGYAAAVAVPAQEADNFSVAQSVVEAMTRYLSHDRVVAIGEIGFERGTAAEEEIFRRQVRLGRDYSVPVIATIPTHDRREAVTRMLAILSEEGIAPNYVLINGVTEETLPYVRHYGSWYGLTIDRNTHQPAERVAHLLSQTGFEGAMIHSAAGRQLGDPLAVPRTARLLLEAGFSQEQVEKLTFHNPKWFFSQARPMPLPASARRQYAEPSSANGRRYDGALAARH